MFFWDALAAGVWLTSIEFGLQGRISTLRWQLPVPAVFASPSHDMMMDDSLFVWVPTFQNQLLAIGTEWIVCTVPLACLVLWLYSRKWSPGDSTGPIPEQDTNST